MKKLQVPLEDELMLELKNYSFKNNITIKDFVTDLIQNALGQSPSTPAEKPKNTQKKLPISTKSDKMKEEKPEKLDLSTVDTSKYFVIRKTHKTKEEKIMFQYQKYGVDWLVMEGYKSHYDADGNIIPFRVHDWDGKLTEPDEEDIKELEEATGKKVIFE